MVTAVLMISTLLTSCYDDSDIKQQLNSYGAIDSISFEAICQEQNSNIGTLKTIVDALGKKDFVTSIAPI